MNDLDIRIDCVTRSGTTLVENFSLSASEGEAVAILGSNGAGKSVVMRAAAMVDAADSSVVQLHEHRWCVVGGVLQPNIPPPWPKLTIALQTPVLWPHLSVQQNVLAWKRFGGDTRDGRLPMDYLQDRFDLPEILEKTPSQLSGGQAQRAALVRTLSLPCDVAFLDEPSSALDVEYAQVLIEVLKRFKSCGGIIVIASHSAGLTKAVADNFVFLKNGRVKETGSVGKLDSPATQELTDFWSLMSGR